MLHRGRRSCGWVACRWSCRHTRGAMVMTETRRGSRRGRGDAEVDAIRTVIEEGRRRNRGKRGRNGRVDAEVDAVKPPEHRGAAGFARSSNMSRTKARVGVANTKHTRERAPTVWLCWTKKKQCGRRRVSEQVSATTRVVAAR